MRSINLINEIERDNKRINRFIKNATSKIYPKDKESVGKRTNYLNRLGANSRYLLHVFGAYFLVTKRKVLPRPITITNRNSRSGDLDNINFIWHFQLVSHTHRIISNIAVYPSYKDNNNSSSNQRRCDIRTACRMFLHDMLFNELPRFLCIKYNEREFWDGTHKYRVLESYKFWKSIQVSWLQKLNIPTPRNVNLNIGSNDYVLDVFEYTSLLCSVMRTMRDYDWCQQEEEN